MSGADLVRNLVRGSCGLSFCGLASVRPWNQPALEIPLPAGAQEGQDCLRLRFGVDAERQLWLEGFDLVGEQRLSRQILGIVE